MQEVLNKLEKLASHSTIKIELVDLPAKTLGSAVFRAATPRNIEITSFSDQNHPSRFFGTKRFLLLARKQSVKTT